MKCESVWYSFWCSVSAGFGPGPLWLCWAWGGRACEHTPVQTTQKHRGSAFLGENPKLKVGRMGKGGKCEGFAIERPGAGGLKWRRGAF